jgi:signal transduction histidine kinase
MKTLRRFIAINMALLFAVALGIAFNPRLPFPVKYEVGAYAQDLSLGHILAIAIAGMAIALLTQSSLSLVGEVRKLALWLGFAYGLIALMVFFEQIAFGGDRAGWLLTALPLGIGVALVWMGRRPLRPEEAAAEIAALKIPDEIRRGLLRQIEESAAQEERNRLARDLHDSIKQQLFSINVGTAAVQERWESDPEGARKALTDVRRSAHEAMVEMQAMLHQLRPEALSTVGLIEALREQCEAQGYRTGAEVTLTLGEPIPDDRMPPGAQDTLFRIGQEMLANAARHARARHVRLWLGRQGDAVTLAVEDDGQGFDSTAPASGMGLRNLKERAVSLGGSLEITSRLGAGTRAQVWAPLTPVAAVSARGLREKSWSLNWSLFFMASACLTNAPSILHPRHLMLMAYLFITLVLFLVATSWWDVRDSRRKFPEASMADLASYRYAGHRARVLMSLVGAWLAYQSGHLPGDWGIASRPLSLLFLALLGIDLFGAHRWSRPTRRPLENWKWPSRWQWPNINHKIMVFFILPLWSVCFLGVAALNHEFWTQTAQLEFIALGAAFLAYFFWRRPRLEGASS